MNKQSEEYKFSEVAKKWSEVLQEKGYGHHISTWNDRRKVKNFTRLWKTIFKSINLNPCERRGYSIFEVGCGGCKHLAMFALNGWECVGLDCSREVLVRAKNYINEISHIFQRNLSIKLIYNDFLKFDFYNKRFNLVFNSGVIEHFLDDRQRNLFLKKMFELTEPGGYVISIVPSGIHPLRKKMREFGLGGYKIPEIDYTLELMSQEFKKCQGTNLKILPFNLFSYVLLERDNQIVFLTKKMLYYISQLVCVSLFPLDFAYRHAGIFIGIAQKPIGK